MRTLRDMGASLPIACLRPGLLCVFAMLAACAGDGFAEPYAPDPLLPLSEEAPDQPPHDAAAYLDSLRQASCVGARRDPESVLLKVAPVPLQGLNPARRTVGELAFVGGFQLLSDDRRFGGLSGIEALDDGNLLAISDNGAFVWIELAEDGFTPKAARLAVMTDLAGQPFASKKEADAEGLAVTQGLALVSFEGDHRVLAFDVARCGAAARGAPVSWSLSRAFARSKLAVGANNGAEALAITPDGDLFVGVEAAEAMGSPLSARPVELAPRFDRRVGKGAPEIVGLDLLASGRGGQTIRAFSLHRSPRALASNAITVMETDFGRDPDTASQSGSAHGQDDLRGPGHLTQTPSHTLAEMNLLFTIDNFEGIAAKELPDGRVRLFLVSDDNFSKAQRTLLMVFDLAAQK